MKFAKECSIVSLTIYLLEKYKKKVHLHQILTHEFFFNRNKYLLDKYKVDKYKRKVLKSRNNIF